MGGVEVVSLVKSGIGRLPWAPVLLRARLFASLPVRPMPVAGSAGNPALAGPLCRPWRKKLPRFLA